MDANIRKVILGVFLETIINIVFAILLFKYGFYGIGIILCIFIVLQVIFIGMMFKKSKNNGGGI